MLCEPLQKARAMVPRMLFMLGHMCRYGADIIEQSSPATGRPAFHLTRCLRINLDYFRCSKGMPARLHSLRALLHLTLSRNCRRSWLYLRTLVIEVGSPSTGDSTLE